MDVAKVRSALRTELEARGYQVSSDSVSLRGECYIAGPDDRTRALFDFRERAGDAAGDLYQGQWSEGMPPRFVVLPATELESMFLSLLMQMRIVPILCEEAGETYTFLMLDELLAQLVGPA